MKIKLGKEVTDKVTGFKGTVTGYAEYITGCAQYLVQPKCKDDGSHVDGRWIDEDRLDVTGPGVTLEVKRDGSDIPAPIR